MSQLFCELSYVIVPIPTLPPTVYTVYLADIKFDELECNANWQMFSLKKDNTECRLLD